MYKFLNKKNINLRLLVLVILTSLTVTILPVNAENRITNGNILQDTQSSEMYESMPNQEISATDTAIEENTEYEEINPIDIGKDVAELDEPEPEQVASKAAVTGGAVSKMLAAPDITELSDTAVLVKSYAELKEAIQGENGYTEFYFEQDILQEDKVNNRPGFSIPESKPEITISGTNPITGIRYKYTEYNSANTDSTITVGGEKKITFKDMNIVGYNQHGTIYSSNNNANINTYIMYDNISYTGPRICNAQYSTLHIKDSDITVPNSSIGASTYLQICDVRSLILEGDVRFEKEARPESAVITIRSSSSNPELKILKNSNVNITGNSSLITNTGEAEVIIEEGATLNCRMKGAMTNKSCSIDALTLKNNATFRYYHTGSNGTIPTMIIEKKLNIGNGAVFEVRRNNGSNDTKSNQCTLIDMKEQQAEIDFIDPERVILVRNLTDDKTKGLIRFIEGGTLNIQTKAINLWETLPSGFNSNIEWNDPLDGWNSTELPIRMWNQNGFEPIQLSATFTSQNQVNPTSINVSGGYVPGSPKNTANFEPANFLGESTKMFTLGNTELNFNNAYDDSEYIEGKTPANAYVDVIFQNEKGFQQDSIITDDTGTFSFPVYGKLLCPSTIEGCVQHNFLRGYDTVTVRIPGTIKFYEVPSTLNYYSSYMPIGAALIEREHNDWNIKIEDTRDNKNTWEVYASLDSPLTAWHNNTTYTLNDALIYKVGSNISSFGTESILIYSGQTDRSSGNNISTIRWNKNEGPLISIKESDILVSDSIYTTTIKWSLVDGPK